MVHIVVGAQWGDEGKGKIVDLLAQKSDAVVRFHGGNNAGHTVINSYGTYPLHLVPSGIFNTRAKAFISNGVVLDLGVLADEIDLISKALPDFSRRLSISPKCHVIMPYHKLLERFYEEAKGKGKTGTTGRGIGPVYADKVSYQGIRLGDFFRSAELKEKLGVILGIKNRIITAFGEKPLDPATVYEAEMVSFNRIKRFVRDTFMPIHRLLEDKKNVLLEGAQGTFLDNDWGTYPFVTASNAVSGAVTAAAGIPPQSIKRVTGVAKSYTTRVGAGPFPTELLDATGERIRAAGHEFGTTTGRPRRCGWFDAELIRFAVAVNGITDLVITKLDVLDDFDSIRICTGYTIGGKRVSYAELDAYDLARVKPIWKEFRGWKSPIGAIRRYRDLPASARHYIEALEREVGVPARLISVGPARHQTIRKP